MNYFKNAISKLYNIVSVPVVSTRDALAEKLQIVRDTAYLLYQKMKENLGHGHKLKYTMEDEAEKTNG